LEASGDGLGEKDGKRASKNFLHGEKSQRKKLKKKSKKNLNVT